ncbi:MAG: 2-C-methyl-D-erythritol 4-phosphate cytidylyltransferase [Candidatus Eremiobacteraeota bacterium]|nr:2-C-methyl-D-erythritol 4-phosphate cytidylyltransferase [Candidatus Eremiobacteraeota bacterium]
MDGSLRWGAVIAAAGRGSRFGGPKQLVELGGAPLASWSIRTFAAMHEVCEIVIVTEDDRADRMMTLASAITKDTPIRVVTGGATRQASVRAGLDALVACDAVLVHDGARPLVRSSDVRKGMRLVSAGRAALLGIPVTDTIKVVDPARDTVLRTLERESLWAAQTPQLAMLADMRRAHAEAARGEIESTDDAALLERVGVLVHIVPGSLDNFKITVPEDLSHAESLVRERLEHSPDEAEVLLVEIFSDATLVDAVCREIESRGGSIDGVDRDYPAAVAIRAFVPAERFEGFGDRFEAVGDGSMTFTTKFSHYAGRVEHA